VSDHILSVEQVTVGFDGFTVLDRLDFRMRHGELRFLIGPNGAGKTTMLDVITGKTRPDSGRVLFDGADTGRLGEHALVRRGIGRKFQTPTVFKDMTVLENLQVASHRQFKVAGNLRRRVSPRPSDAEVAVAERTGLLGMMGRTARELSHGQLQWLELAMVISQRPEVILLDEPAAGMTAAETDKTAELLLDLAGNHTVLVIEHDMAFVRRICRTITVLHQGKMLAEGTAEDIEKDPSVIEAYLGSATLSHD